MAGKSKQKSAPPDTQLGMPMAYRPPSPGKMIRMASEHAARVAVDAHPKTKAMRNSLTDAIHGAIKTHLGPMRRGRFG